MSSSPPVVVMDSGGESVRAGLVVSGSPAHISCDRFTAESTDFFSMPNCTVRGKRGGHVLGELLDTFRDHSCLNFRRPVERGIVVDWELERTIWARAIERLGVNPKVSSLVLTEPPLLPPAAQRATTEVVFEHFGFASHYRGTSAGFALAAHRAEDPAWAAAEGACVVDAGFSFTHSLCLYDGFPVERSVRRIDLGGKALTNLLKEVLSFRHLNLMDETYVVNGMKERLCYCALDFEGEMAVARSRGAKNTIRRDFVLPDYVHSMTGYVKGGEGDPGNVPSSAEQVVPMNNERVSIMETLFHPSDVGLCQTGLAETVMLSVSECPEPLRPTLLSHVLAVGGCARSPGFAAKLAAELQPLSPDQSPVHVVVPRDPQTIAWRGARALAMHHDYPTKLAVTRAEYQERGHYHLANKFLR
jgi:actin-related protein 6